VVRKSKRPDVCPGLLVVRTAREVCGIHPIRCGPSINSRSFDRDSGSRGDRVTGSAEQAPIATPTKPRRRRDYSS
ncbi:MAG TPA: hypothetical protein VFL67_18295, partial [Mycobacterium sp.]|nr:hypothetical protein [Mycobacterium sp.]